MRKLLPYIFILILIGSALGYFLYRFSPATLEKRESDFAVRSGYVTRVVMTDRKAKKMTLVKKQNQWFAQGIYPTNEEAISSLLFTLSNIATLYPAPINAQPNIIKDIHHSGIKCEIYTDDTTQPEKTYWVGGTNAEGSGSYLLMEQDGKLGSQPYFVHIPGHDVAISNIYNPDLIRWRTRWIIRDNEKTIQKLTVDYPREPSRSFSITRLSADSFVIADGVGDVTRQPKLKHILQYLSFYEALSMESYENESPLRDSLRTVTPYCHISLLRTDSTRTEVVIHYKPIDESTHVRYDDDGRAMLFDIERYFAFINGKQDFVMVQYYVWGKALRSYEEFFSKPKAN